jgi:N-acetylmuramoyl-L-alanine amidase
MSKIKIAIDAGHGSDTPGKRTAPFKKLVKINNSVSVQKGEQYREHYANVGISKLLFTELVSRGYDAIKTGWNDVNARDDADISLTARQKAIKAAKCDISVSIHFNAAGSGTTFNSAQGMGIYIHDKYSNDSQRLAQIVLNELIKGTKQTNRGINADDLAMCNCKNTGTKASILIEVAFMTNEHEAEDLMANSKFWAETAVEIANGIDTYLRR